MPITGVPLATDKTDTTPATTDHADHHNGLAVAVNELAVVSDALADTYVTLVEAGGDLAVARPVGAAAVYFKFDEYVDTGVNGANITNAVAGDTFFVPTPPDAPPATPTGLTATPGDTTVALGWADNTELDIARYEYRVDGGTAVSTGLVSAATVTGLTNAVEYDFEVRAVDDAEQVSAWTAVVSSTPGGPVVLASDSFTGGDDTDISGRTTDSALGGTGKTWGLAGGSNRIGITSGKAVIASGSSAATYGFNAGDGDVLAKVTVSALTAGSVVLLARHATLSTNTYYGALISATSNALQLRKTVSDTVTSLGAAQTWANGDVIGVRCFGSTIELYKNGVVLVTVTDTSIANTNHMVGFRAGASTTMQLDDLTVIEA